MTKDSTRDYYAAQAALGVLLGQRLAAALPPVDPLRIAARFPDVRAVAAAVGEQFALASVSLAADYYEDVRIEAGVPGTFRVPVVEPPRSASFEVYIDKAASALLDSIDAVVDDLYLAELLGQVETEVVGAAQTLTAEAGRSEVFQAASADDKAIGWARVTRPNACSFCRLLASRGPVYSTKGTASFRAHTVVDGRGGVCQCVAEPVFSKAHELTALQRGDAALWQRVSADGFKGSEALNEFRRRVEGREDGRRVKPARRTPASPAETQARRASFDALNVSELSRQREILLALSESDYRTKQLDRVDTRLAELRN